MILGENGEKMSKSRGNVVNPDDVVAEYGADTLRLFIMFIGDFEKAAPWSSQSIKGCKRFLERVFNLLDIMVDGDDYGTLEKNFHKTIKKVSADIEDMKFNTAIAALMALLNDINAAGSITKKALSDFIILVSPFAPHLAEEMWQLCGHAQDITTSAVWPTYDEGKTVDESIQIPVQINGKLRSLIAIAPDSDQQVVLDLAMADEKIKAAIDGKSVLKTIYVKNKLINLVVK
jgi:leucyl-tRNA synthetase